MSNTRVQIAGVELKNPVMTASGTFGSGEEFSEYVNLNQLGAVVTKGVANVPWPGNPVPRVTETASGMLNAIGLQNPGIDVFCQRDIPFLRQFDTRIVVNVCGRSVRDYCEVAERLADEPVDLLEINVSCPNVKEGGIAFGQDPAALENITKEVKRFARQPIILKLSPNVTDITVMAKAAQAGGADAISLINTLTGMKIDIYRRTFALANRTGGLSGPAIKPVALRMVGGFAVYFGLNTLLKLPFSKEFLEQPVMAAFLVRTVRYAIVVFVMLAVYPMLFGKVIKNDVGIPDGVL